MGRPVNKRFFGALDDGTNITINCQVASNSESAVGYIIAQRSVNKFLAVSYTHLTLPTKA